MAALKHHLLMLESVKGPSPSITATSGKIVALTDADKHAVLAMFDLKVSGRATAGCRQPHIVTGVKEDMA